MPYGSLRIMIGVLAALFALSFGRSIIRMMKGTGKQSSAISWTLRTLVALTAVLWHVGFDKISVATIVLSALSFAGGAYLEWRPKHHDELEKVMFPPES